MKLCELGEFGFIDRIAARIRGTSGVRTGIGDDAAVTEPQPGRLVLTTSDMLVEGIHFDLSFCDPLNLGRKALSVNLSDIAAMGGEPRHFLLSVAIPPGLPLEFLDLFMQGLLEVADRFGVVLIGGDTCSSSAGFVISITLIGEQFPEFIVRRAGAQPGDLVCVTGFLGDSAYGLELLRQGERTGGAVERHLNPQPRVAEGLALAGARLPSAMIDVSDGLLADLRHILDLSGVGATLQWEKIPLSPGLRGAASLSPDQVRSLALAGGEDYELLFTLPPEKYTETEQLLRALGTQVAVIGTVESGGALQVFSPDGHEVTPSRSGFKHFAENS